MSATTSFQSGISKGKRHLPPKKLRRMFVTTRCKEIAERKFEGKKCARGSTKFVAQPPKKFVSREELINNGSRLHDVIASAEEEQVRLTFISENNRRECELANLVNKLEHLVEHGSVNEIKFVIDINKEIFTGRIDRLNWSDGTIEICDLKTHGFKMPIGNNKPDLPAKTEYYYRLQLHFYAKMVRAYMVDELTPENRITLRRKMIGGLLNPNLPIHPVIANRSGFDPAMNINDLFERFLRAREVFVNSKIKLAVYHLCQTDMEASIQVNKTQVEVTKVQYKYIRDFLSNQDGSDKAYMQARKRGYEEAKKAAAPPKKKGKRVVKKATKRSQKS